MEGRIAIKLIQENGGKRMKGGRGLKGAAERSLSLRAVQKKTWKDVGGGGTRWRRGSEIEDRA